MFGLGFAEMAIIGAIAVLLFGKNLPSVARSLGSSYSQFKKGLSDIQSSIDTSDVYSSPSHSSSYSSPSYDDYDDFDEPQAPKFEVPPVESTADSAKDQA